MKSQVDRLAALSELSEKLEGKTIYKKKVFLIMDKNRKLLVKGVPQNRSLCFVDDTKDRKRIMTYNSAGVARNSGLGYYIPRTKDVKEYLAREYGDDSDNRQREYLEPVEAEMTVKLKYEYEN